MMRRRMWNEKEESLFLPRSIADERQRTLEYPDEDICFLSIQLSLSASAQWNPMC